VSGRGRDALGAAIAVVVSLGASLAVAEVALRWLRPMPLGFSQLSPDGLQLHVRDHEGVYQREEFAVSVRTNELGFRGPAFAVPKPPDRFRVLAVGDSFTEGLQVEEADTVSEQLAGRLAGGAQKVEVLNLGVSGYGTADVIAMLRTFGPRLEPDRVALFFCLGNDVRNNVQSELCRMGEAGVECRQPERPSARRLAVASLKAQLGARFQLYQLLRAATASPSFQRLGLRAATQPESTPEMPFESDIYREPEPAYLVNAHALTQGMLAILRDEVQQLGADLWVVLIPTREQVEEAGWDALVAADARPDSLHRDRPQRAVGALARALGIPVVDLFDAFRAHADAGERLYWRIDAHWNAMGHALAADEVASAWSREAAAHAGAAQAAPAPVR